MKHINVLENVSIVCGVAVSLPLIESILGIIILCVQIILILWKFGYKIYKLIKQKKYDEIQNTLEDAKGELENLKDKTDGKH